MVAADVEALRAELIAGFRDPRTPFNTDDAAFDDLARRVFARNFDGVPAYRSYCEARGITPGSLDDWTRIPAVPTAAFREVTLLAEDRSAERVFRTSGTTRGPERRGQHHVADLELYRSSARSTFRRFLLPDAAEPRFLSLMPPAEALPDSSLAFMISDVSAAFGAPGSASFADAHGIDYAGLERAIAEGMADDAPVLLLGTSAAFIHWLDRLERTDGAIQLPSGSRLMDTGGYKGKGRAMDPAELRDLYATRLGLPPHACVNEYGMTELLSQRYDGGLVDHHSGERGPFGKRGPPWLRTLAVDPETLEPLPAGERGILRHVDLANLDSVAAVQTEDFGRVENGGVVLEGRAAGAPPRGCSIAMDLLLEGARG